jgi:hypothetical protein
MHHLPVDPHNVDAVFPVKYELNFMHDLHELQALFWPQICKKKMNFHHKETYKKAVCV